MSTINQVNSSPPPTSVDSDNGRTATGNGALATIDALIAMLQKMNGEIRDMQRDYYAQQQQTAHTKDITAMATKEQAIELNYKAARGNAVAKIFSGVASGLGAIGGGFIGSGGEAFSNAANGVGKMVEGGMALSGAGKSREAQQLQLKGDYQSSAASDYWKNLAATADKAAEASRRMLEMTRELMSLQDRILGAVRL